MKIFIQGEIVMNRYITNTSTLNGQSEHGQLAHGFSYLRKQQNLTLLSEDVCKFSQLAHMAATPLVNAYFVAGVNELETEHQGGFFEREGVSGFNTFMNIMDKFNPILKQVLGFKLVDVPL